MNTTILSILAMAIATLGSRSAQSHVEGQTVAISDKEVSVLEFEELKYPVIAQYAPFESEGVEVIRVKLDDQGRVVQATALSGNDLLIPDCLANSKKWRFQPSATKTAILVYNLKRSSGECKSASSVFSFRDPNFVNVTGCLPLGYGHAFQFARFQQGDMISNSDIQAVHFDSQLKYPPLARQARVEGVVVLRLKLNDKGAVVDVLPLSGLPILIPTCVANAKNWQFKPNSQKSAIFVYNFSLVINDPGQVFFQPPNFVTITGEPIAAQPER